MAPSSEPMRDETALCELERIVQGAAALALQWSAKRSELSLDEKSAGQFASDADLEIEKRLRGDIAASFVNRSIIGEELGGGLGASDAVWAVDPIDGTSNFLLGLPLWGISAGYLEQGEAILGAIALPEFGMVLSARQGGGLRMNGAVLRGPPRLSRVKVMALGENDFEPGPETDQRAQAFRDQGFAVVRYRCAVFSLASAALGRLSGYVENGCGLWDIAAAEIVCREAGMSVKTANCAPNRYAIDARWRD